MLKKSMLKNVFNLSSPSLSWLLKNDFLESKRSQTPNFWPTDPLDVDVGDSKAQDSLFQTNSWTPRTSIAICNANDRGNNMKWIAYPNLDFWNL